MNVKEMFPSRYLKADDLDGREFTLAIRGVEKEEIGKPPDKEDKWVLYFRSAKKGLILNRTNAMAIAELYGEETSGWVGKRVTLYSARVKAFGKWYDVVRVRAPAPASPSVDGNGPVEPDSPDDLEDRVDDIDVNEGHSHGAADAGQDGGGWLGDAEADGPVVWDDGWTGPEHIGSAMQWGKQFVGSKFADEAAFDRIWGRTFRLHTAHVPANAEAFLMAWYVLVMAMEPVEQTPERQAVLAAL